MNENNEKEMKRSKKAEQILQGINNNTKLGDLRKIAKDIKKDHALAMELWSTKEYMPRLLAILIMDKKLLSEELLNKLDDDMLTHPFNERNYLMDWLMANQLMKDKKTIALDEMVSKGCTPNYMPEFIAIEVSKRQISVK